MRELSVRKRESETSQVEKTATVVFRKIRSVILDDVFKPGDWLPEVDLARRFEVSRSSSAKCCKRLRRRAPCSPSPIKGAVAKPLSIEEVLDIAELRLVVITLAAKEAYRHLSPADFDVAYGLAKQIARRNSAKEQFELQSALLGDPVRGIPTPYSLGGVSGNWMNDSLAITR
jgi:DNA-binding GntR family transcriptional regulator